MRCSLLLGVAHGKVTDAGLCGWRFVPGFTCFSCGEIETGVCLFSPNLHDQNTYRRSLTHVHRGFRFQTLAAQKFGHIVKPTDGISRRQKGSDKRELSLMSLVSQSLLSCTKFCCQGIWSKNNLENGCSEGCVCGLLTCHAHILSLSLLQTNVCHQFVF